jgi:hypothetical protein
LRNTIVAGNQAASNRDIAGALDPASSYNLVGDGTGLSGISNGTGGNLVGSFLLPLDPRLGPLGNNGGPTRTQALLDDSPARGAGSLSFATPTDQRGLPRTIGGQIDLGAFQSQSVAGPQVALADPSGVIDPPVNHVRITFNHPMNPATLTTDAFSLTGPGGGIPLTAVAAVPGSGGQQFDVAFAAQSVPGDYALVLGTGVQDTHGNQPAGQYTDRFILPGLTGCVLTVNSTADTASAADPYLSLREAIALVNSPTLPGGLSPQILGQISGTLHAHGLDTIVFDPNHGTGVIQLSQGQLELGLPSSTARVTVNGGGAVTVDGNNASRILQVDRGVLATLDHLTLTHGHAFTSSSVGGAISNSGTLTVSNTSLVSNSAFAYGGGIYNDGTLTLTDSTLLSNSAIPNQPIGAGVGGGLYNAGTMTVANSIIRANRTSGGQSSGEGGGIGNVATMTLMDCTLDSNVTGGGRYSANGFGGGISNTSGSLTVSRCLFIANRAQSGDYPFGNGGAIANSATLTVFDSTFTANYAGVAGGGIWSSGTFTVNSSTLTGNTANQGGGIFNASAGTLTLGSTIAANNDLIVFTTPGSGPDIQGRVNTSSSYNLVGEDDGSLSGISNGTNHNQIGTPTSPIDPQFSPLGYDGGPTQTFALIPGSPAHNAGDPGTSLTTDQRGLPRVVAGSADFGAFQTQANPILVTTLLDPGQLSGLLSLREAVNLANVLPGSNTISFDPGLASGTVTLSAGELLLRHDLAINGSAGGPVTVSGNNASRVFEVAGGTSVSLSGLTIANGLVSSASLAQGGGILNAGNLTLTDCSVLNNQVAVTITGTATENVFAQGGGIRTTGSLTLLRCTLSGNSATLSAGNVYSGNANGGALYNNGEVVTLTNCTVSGNSASATFTGGAGVVFAYGGGLTSDFGTQNLLGCTVNANSATGGNSAGYGGGVHSFQSTVTLSNCTIAYNTASSSGGAGLGGGVSGLESSLTLTSCTITGNAANSATSTGSGGGLWYNSSVGTAQVLNTIVAGNSSGSDGPDASGSFTSEGYNLIGITDGSTGWGGSDLTGTAGSPLDPMLGTLGNYGGPTETIPLLAGSPALNAGDPGQLGTADQRGAVRSGRVNIGAFQASAASFVVSAPASATTGVPFDVSVAVYDSFGQLAVGYTGTIHFSSTDGDPGVVLPPDYTFQLSDGGVVTFSAGVTLYSPGAQTLTATDLDSGIAGSTVVTL